MCVESCNIYIYRCSSVSLVYGSQKCETKVAKNDAMNPRWHETLNIKLSYNGQLLFPETIELVVHLRSQSENI